MDGITQRTHLDDAGQTIKELQITEVTRIQQTAEALHAKTLQNMKVCTFGCVTQSTH